MREALVALFFFAVGTVHAQRQPDFPPARVGAIVYVTPIVVWKRAIADAVDSNATVRAGGQSQLDWPLRLRPEQACRTSSPDAGAVKPLPSGSSVLSQRPLDISVEPDGSSASEVGALIATDSDPAAIAAHYLRGWQRKGRDWRVVFVCTSPLRRPSSSR